MSEKDRERAREYASGCDNESGAFLSRDLEAIRFKAYLAGLESGRRDCRRYPSERRGKVKVHERRPGAPGFIYDDDPRIWSIPLCARNALYPVGSKRKVTCKRCIARRERSKAR